MQHAVHYHAWHRFKDVGLIITGNTMDTLNVYSIIVSNGERHFDVSFFSYNRPIIIESDYYLLQRL